MSTDFLTIFGSLPFAVLVAVAGIMGLLTFNALFSVWYERKLAGRIQNRLGPTEMGPAGTLQTIVDMVKLISKQIIIPKNIDRPLYYLAPVVLFAPVVASVALFPFSESWAVTDVDIGLVLVFAFAGIGIIGIFMAGWGSNNKYALLGAMRSVAQNISYEIPLILSTLSVVLMTRTMNLQDIVLAQASFPFLLVQPLAALIYVIAATAETNRAPFDIPEAESELVAGFHTEYSGMGFAMFMFGEYSNMLIVSMVATVLFLGGWHGPVLPGPVWFLLKTYLVLTVIIWFRWTFPRLRFDQLMTFAWGLLIPLSILNLLVTGLVLKLL
ncbi:MAG: NADH-quinone oxidoreductase subunit H [Myxococcales bacterium]